MSTTQDITVEAVKASPSLAVVGGLLAGVDFNSVFMALSCVLVGLQIFFIVRDRWWRDRKGKRRGKADANEG